MLRILQEFSFIFFLGKEVERRGGECSKVLTPKKVNFPRVFLPL